MRHVRAAMLLISLPLLVQGETTSVEGVYQRVSLANVVTGFSPEKGNRKGLLQMANGHYSMMTINLDRRVLRENENLADMEESEQIAYLQD